MEVKPEDIKGHNSGKSFGHVMHGIYERATPTQIRGAIGAVWVLFVLAVIMSNIFVLAGQYGPMAAIEFGSIVGPIKRVSEWHCGRIHMWTDVDNCTSYKDVATFEIRLKFIFAAAVVLSWMLWVWARARTKAVLTP